MGMEAAPFLRRLEVLSRVRRGKSTYRKAFFEGAHVLVVRCGIGPSRAASAIRNLDERPAWIVGVGTAGALEDSLRVGQIVISARIVCAEESARSYQADPVVMDTLCKGCERAHAAYRVGTIASSRTPVFDRRGRHDLRRKTGALAVDMESYWLAQEAERFGIPFAALRVISDDIAAPPLPEYTDWRSLARSPLDLIRRIPPYLRWRTFLRDFRAAIEELPPALVEALRCWNR
ncbi:MAG: hypothetical protein ACPL7J_06225 [Desulfomonilaceae bacterium]